MNPSSTQNWLTPIGVILLGSMIGMFFAFHNGYPIVYSDTGPYIGMGFDHRIGYDRSFYYGLFVRHFSLRASLWLIVFLQSALTSWLVYLWFRQFIKGSFKYLAFLATTVVLTLASAYSFTVSVLLPDVFCATAFLSFIHLLTGNIRSMAEKTGLSIIFLFSIGSHLSNIPVFATLVGFLWLSRFLSRNRKTPLLLIHGSHLKFTSLMLALGILMLPTMNLIFGGKFRLSDSSSSRTFAIYHLIDTGVLQEYLDKACEKGKDYRLCGYQDRLGWNFMWNADSPLNLTGGKKANAEDFKDMLTEIYTTPEYVVKLVLKSFEFTARQYFSFDASTIGPQLESSAPYGQIMWHFKLDKAQYVGSRQNTDNLEFEYVNILQLFLVLSSICWLFYLMLYQPYFRALSAELRLVVFSLVFFTCVNAFFCSNLSTVDGRYQSRIAWMMPVVALFSLSHLARMEILAKPTEDNFEN